MASPALKACLSTVVCVSCQTCHMRAVLTRTVACSYLAVIRGVRDKLPSSASGKLRLCFTWFDAFKPRSKTYKYTWDFEAANVWYNLGALHSSLGAHQDRSSQAGVRAAFKHYQEAVAAFTHLKEEIVPTLEGNLPAEFNQAGLDMCIELHRGHGQSCFYEKAKMSSMKPGVLARLAMQASVFYGSASTHCAVRACVQPSRPGSCRLAKLTVSPVVPALQSPVLSRLLVKEGYAKYCQYKTEVFKAAAEWQQSRQILREAEAKSEGYGIEIAWLKRAHNSCQRALGHCSQPGDRESAQALQTAIQTRLNVRVAQQGDGMPDRHGVAHRQVRCLPVPATASHGRQQRDLHRASAA